MATMRKYKPPPQCPDGYYWLFGQGDTPYAALELYAFGDEAVDDVLLGTFYEHHDVARNHSVWVWRHNFRSMRFDTLEQGMRVMIAKYRLGAREEERRVF